MITKNEFIVPWNKSTCRKIINNLKDGVPPPIESIELISVGYEAYLQKANASLEFVSKGGHDTMILEGSYGKGKSHLLNLIGAVAASKEFSVKRVEVGSGRVYLNKPDALFEQIVGGDEKPRYYEYEKYAPYNNDKTRKFIAGLALFARKKRLYGMSGLVILIDELENTFSNYNLPNFRSRAKSYEILDAFFKGGVEQKSKNNNLIRGIVLENTFIVFAITPGSLLAAQNDFPSFGYNSDNPALEWNLPDQYEINPLTLDQANILAHRIREVHRVAFEWPASEYVPNEILSSICCEWEKQGSSRSERDLVKRIIEFLEIAEQNY